MAFSVDLRERAIAAVDNGMRVAEVAKTFQVSIRVVYDWIELRKRTGGISPKIGYQKGHSHKIQDWEKFKIFVEKNKGLTSLQMATKWNMLTESDLSDDTILRGLEKIGYTSKKKRLGTQNQTKLSERFFWKKSKI